MSISHSIIPAVTAKVEHSAKPLTLRECEAVLSLLDDTTPEVARYVEERLAATDGDVSEMIAELPVRLTHANHRRLALLLRPARRERLEREWLMPGGGAAALADDWEAFEGLLRQISDFLHDGVTLRQPMSDALDLWAEEAEEIETPRALRAWLFAEGRLFPVLEREEISEFDPVEVLAGNNAAPVAACIVFCLIALRLGIEVRPARYGESIFCRFYEDGEEWLVSMEEGGNADLLETILEQSGMEDDVPIIGDVLPGDLLLFYLCQLAKHLAHEERADDLRLIKRLILSLS